MKKYIESDPHNLPLFTFEDKTSLEKSGSLLRIFEDIHNHIYANDGLSPEQALEETLKILFIKIFDEKNKKLGFNISSNEYSNLLNGNNDLDFLNRFKDLQENTFCYFSTIFDSTEKIKLKPTTLAFVVNKLQFIDLLKSSNDIKGLAFQKFIHSSQRIGRGQFFTPEPVIKLCVDIIQPKANEKILDPACGSGGFLISALKYVVLNTPSATDYFAKDNIFGLEINRSAAKMATMRMILEGDGFSKIILSDSLTDWSTLNFDINKVCGTNNPYQNYFDVILTNPPFGTQGKISNKAQLRNFALGHKWNCANNQCSKTDSLVNGQVPEILFIERCLEFLKPGGRMAIVLPNGDFENSTLTYLRTYILELADLIAVVKLPQETFIPSGTGVKTSLLFLRKKNGDNKVPKKILFGNVTKLGYLGNKNGSLVYRKDEKGNINKDIEGNLLIDEDFSDVVNSYLSFCSEGISKKSPSENCFTINRDELNISRFDYEFYKPNYRQLAQDFKDRKLYKLGDLVKLSKSKSEKLKQKDLIINYVELSDISAYYSEIINSTEYRVHDLPSRASFELKTGELLTAVAGNSIGTSKHVSAIVTEEYAGSICTNGFRVLIPNKQIVNPFYLLYYFRSKYFLEQIFRFRTGAAIPAISDADLLNIQVFLPEKEEQNRIGKILLDGFQQRKLFREKIETLEINL
ncbi:N-6 DNA methylase [Dehalococcoides mccartyi]|uniref:N-6 DNA methylase n=1 Tax=Dehalococcoides mccartyi TaxID=61435 RepID=UPI0006BDFD55|nr:N-6 DNA methylase [Dehalococcoides mccartyi]BAS31213.1 type III restriction-modification protein, methylation subunit [Dehalococcoides mccartyi IBARAKI]